MDQMLTDDPRKLLEEMTRIRETVQAEAAELMQRWEPMLKREEFRASAENLAHYLALRRTDMRPVQAALVPWGVASIGRCEARVMPTLNAIIANLQLISRANADPLRPTRDDFLYGQAALHRHTEAVLGLAPKGRETRIMVTLSTRAATDAERVKGLVRAGMDCARINCAHDDPETWAAMIANVRAAARANGCSCPVLMDLAGPKIRTRQVLTPPDRKTVKPGDRIFLSFAKPVENSEFGFQTCCTMPSVLNQVGVGAAASIKDGLIQGVIDELRADGLVMRVERTPPDGQPLQKEKGINFPGTALALSPLTESDLAHLDFVTEHADIVSYSFVQRPSDIAQLQDEIAKRRGSRAPMPIVAKIETQLAFDNLPDLIVQAAGANPFAVMIARGDLAVEVGYERLSEVQEEILWVCEAARVPVIWATQVLESLVKRGMPSRGEFTDAAMAQRAECVMLNKGQFVRDGIVVLDNVLRRMESHKHKRSAQLRPLKAWADLH
ncbi:MAG: pyruvate kinase [Xanthobacteraceae bacterium]